MLRIATLGAVVLLLGCNSGATPTATPAASAPPTAAPSATPTSAATPAPSPGTTVDPNLPIGGDDWGDSAPGEVGERYLFTCPPDGDVRSIWGTDIYTSDSSVCTAGVHSGLITFAQGGSVVIENRPGQESYIGSFRNGVTSSSYPSWVRSFVFVDGPVAGPTPGTTPDMPPGDPLVLAHIPPAFNIGCHEVTTLSAGEVIAVSCMTPSGKGYVTYTLFDTSANLQDKFFGDLEYFAPGVTGTDCAIGPCLVAKAGSTGLTEGRLFANTYTGIDPNGVIAYWFDDSLLIQAGIVTYDTTFAELYDLALEAGPVP